MILKGCHCILWSIFILLSAGCGSADQQPVALNLASAEWEFRQAGQAQWLPAEVPGCVHTDLLHNGVIDAPFYRDNETDQQWIDKLDWEYRCFFDVPEDLLSDFPRARLVFEGLDTYANVYLNDSLIITAENMHRRWTAEVQDLRLTGNELRVHFLSPIQVGLELHAALPYELPAINDHSEIGGTGDKKVSVFVRKALHHFGWDWGPRFVTSGIWRPVFLEFINSASIDHVYFSQEHYADSLVRITTSLSLEGDRSKRLTAKITDANTGELLAESDIASAGTEAVSLQFEIHDPVLWWTNGLGDQHLYRFKTALYEKDKLIDEQVCDIGLRTIKLVREKDTTGRSFYFELNGKPVYMKGANYIPQDMFVPRVPEEKYKWLLESARDANFNMIRAWGGGIYENDLFYDLCDQLGILVWQDFMFACTMHPGDSAFLENVRQEAIDNVIRLRNHPSLALWCGNNEMLQAWHNWGYHEGNKYGWSKADSARIWSDYLATFHQVIPDVLSTYDPATDYWPSSPAADINVPQAFHSGDYHYWKNRTQELPVTVYHNAVGRFMSEYGKGSYPEFNSVKRFTAPEDWTSGVRSYAKPPGEKKPPWRKKGDSNYFSRNFNQADDYPSSLYLSQLLQYFLMDHAIEAHRWSKPQNMGSLFWMLDECWPVGCGSAVDYYGRWKGAMYLAKRNFNDLFITAKLLEDEIVIYGMNDRMEDVDVTFIAEVCDFAGNTLWKYSGDVQLDHVRSNILGEFNTAEVLPGDADPSGLYLHLQLVHEDEVVSENFKYFVPFKDLELSDPGIESNVSFTGDTYVISLQAKSLAKFVFLTLDTPVGKFSDNFFDLPPGTAKTITFTSPDIRPGLESAFEMMTLNMIR